MCCKIVNFLVPTIIYICTVAVNEAGDTLLSLECSRGDLEMVKVLLINKDIDPKSKRLSMAVT